MSEFADIIGVPYTGHQKSKQEIRETTKGKPEKPPNYQYGKKLPEWDSSLPAGAEDLLARCEPMHDRILVRLISDTPEGAILLTDPKPLIGGCRKALVLKTGPGKWIPDDDGHWRRPVSVKAGDTVLIGNWVDLEVQDIALCQEGDVRGIWGK